MIVGSFLSRLIIYVSQLPPLCLVLLVPPVVSPSFGIPRSPEPLPWVVWGSGDHGDWARARTLADVSARSPSQTSFRRLSLDPEALARACASAVGGANQGLGLSIQPPSPISHGVQGHSLAAGRLPHNPLGKGPAPRWGLSSLGEAGSWAGRRQPRPSVGSSQSIGSMGWPEPSSGSRWRLGS